ncbi:MAG TPA: CBS domain-containing protein [Pseudonocardiaceae bacterium]|jgi:CBS-domain-containing membrane protein|nr:CBS domain-containing protein [Pseudonocardiaceae bacterium]
MRKPIVADVMTRELVTVSPGTPFADIVDLVDGHEISAVPVVDEQGVLLGVVSEADLPRGEDAAGDGAEARPAASPAGAAGATAAELMSAPERTVHPTAYLPSAARQLAKADVRRLFVLEEDKLVGVVARQDLMRGFANGDEEFRLSSPHAEQAQRVSSTTGGATE